MREVRQEEEEEHRCAERILIGLENDTEEYFSVVLVGGGQKYPQTVTFPRLPICTG